jgi:hypothetical protein
MRAATAEEHQDLSAMIREFDKLRGEVVTRLDRLHHLAQQIDRTAAVNGDAHVSLVVRGASRTLVALGQGLGRMRSLRTAERTNSFRREEDQRAADVRQAAKDALEARRAAREVIVVPEEDDG